MIINPHLIKRILVLPTKEYTSWKHEVGDQKILFWKRHFNYWYYVDPYFGTYSEEEMLNTIDKKYLFYKDGVIYEKSHVILEFSETHKESIYFDSNEEMEVWVNDFVKKFNKTFIYI